MLKFYRHFCDCGPHFFCGNVILQTRCAECGSDYVGPDCDVARPLPIALSADGRYLCKACEKALQRKHQ